MAGKAFKHERVKPVSAGMIKLINDEHEAVSDAVYQGYVHAIKCGTHLIEAKEIVTRRKEIWKDWLAEHCPDIPERTDRLYRRLADEENQKKIEDMLDCDRQRVAALSIRSATALLKETKPDEEEEDQTTEEAQQQPQQPPASELPSEPRPTLTPTPSTMTAADVAKPYTPPSEEPDLLDSIRLPALLATAEAETVFNHVKLWPEEKIKKLGNMIALYLKAQAQQQKVDADAVS
jgi:hypothetical protein